MGQPQQGASILSQPKSRPVVLCILDGWGYREEKDGNAVALASTPVFDRLWADRPHCLLRTDGEEVGLPEGQFGNSEVGHLNLGAGRVVLQELPRIDRALREGEVENDATFQRFVEAVRGGSGHVHLMGLVSPGGVHAHQRHMVAMARLLAGAGLEVWLHAFTDGRDTPPQAGKGYLEDVTRELAGLRGLKPATVIGRYYAMDRDKRWERTQRAYAAMVAAEGQKVGSWQEAMEASYADGTTDEFVEPRVVNGYEGAADGDGLMCVNFRADRVRQLLGALLLPGFDGFERGARPTFSRALGMTSYSAELDKVLDVLFKPHSPQHILGEVIAEHGLKQLRLAETEKYAHVTFFFNGGEEQPYPGEERILVPSPKVATYDKQPAMSAGELTDRFVEAVGEGRFDFILINFANPDMVGHTGVLEAGIKAVETVDSCLGRAVEAVGRAGGVLLVTADHGNCEMMIDPETGGPHTAHTTNRVPCILVGDRNARALRDGRLGDVAPTVLRLLGLEQPDAMTGRSLIG
jgi:2,3-bisphosphoglycerate-independent phosphoglycerate mutase